jgi:soluble lytic murein transglycosylase
MKRLIKLLIVALALAVAFVVVVQPAWYLRTRYPLKYPKTIETHAANYHLPAALVAAVIMQESGFNPHVKSHAGAVGLMQLTPKTAKGIALRTGGGAFTTDDLLTPEISIRYGCWYLEHLHKQFKHDDTYIMTLAAYNAGQGRVLEWVEQDADHILTVDDIPFDETRAYVKRVREIREKYEKAYPNLA